MSGKSVARFFITFKWEGRHGKRFRSLRTINVVSSVKSELRQWGSQAKLSSTSLACTSDETSSDAGEGPPVVSRFVSLRSVIPNGRFLSQKRPRRLQIRRLLLREDRKASRGSRAFHVSSAIKTHMRKNISKEISAYNFSDSHTWRDFIALFLLYRRARIL